MFWLVDLDPQCLLNKNRKWNFPVFGNYIWQLPYYRKLLLHEINANLQNLCHPWNSIHKTNVQKNGSGSLRTWSLGCLWKQLHNVYFTHAVSLIFFKFACMHVHPMTCTLYIFYWFSLEKVEYPKDIKEQPFIGM